LTHVIVAVFTLTKITILNAYREMLTILTNVK